MVADMTAHSYSVQYMHKVAYLLSWW